MEDRPVPDYSQAIAGARAWQMAPTLWARTGGILWSVAMLNHWRDGEEIVAKCEVGHPAPAPGCSCGVYAWRNIERMVKNGYNPSDHRVISGVVAGAGRVIRGDMGYWVAERVVVLAFCRDPYPSPAEEVLEGSGVYLPTKEEAARVYDVPIIEYEDFEGFCDDYDLIRF